MAQMQLTHQALTLGQSGEAKQQQPRERHLSESLAGSTSGSDGSLKENHRPTENNNTNDGRFKNSTDTNGTPWAQIEDPCRLLINSTSLFSVMK